MYYVTVALPPSNPSNIIEIPALVKNKDCSEREAMVCTLCPVVRAISIVSLREICLSDKEALSPMALRKFNIMETSQMHLYFGLGGFLLNAPFMKNFNSGFCSSGMCITRDNAALAELSAL